MLILGIETSCDETGAAVVENGSAVRSDVLYRQEELHAPFGGVVPELACRRHVSVIDSVVKEAMARAGVGPKDLDAVAVTRGPGLMGALLVGVGFAKAFAYRHQRPLIGVNHLEGHLAAVGLEPGLSNRIEFPLVALVVSGGHTHLYRMDSSGSFRQLGKTVDDAAGEAFDKGAKMLGLGFPGGPAIDRLAREGDPKAVRFPRPDPGKEGFDFSFSGLKTSLKYYLNRTGPLSDGQRADVAAAYQQAVVDILIEKSLSAVNRFGARGLIVAGGVAANSVLRRDLESRLGGTGKPLMIPRPSLCTDNGAMIAAAAFRHAGTAGKSSLNSLFALTASAHLPLG
jgi:N6-L-threonylcarbamoyladenine synthase